MCFYCLFVYGLIIIIKHPNKWWPNNWTLHADWIFNNNLESQIFWLPL